MYLLSRPDRFPVPESHVEGRRCDLLLGLGGGCAGRLASRLEPLVVADPPSLPVDVSRASAGYVPRRVQRIVRGSRPRISLPPRAPVDCDRLGWLDRYRERPSASADGCSDVGISPSGMRLVLNGGEGVAPFTRTVIRGSTNSISAITPQAGGKWTYAFSAWSDGGPATHQITASATKTYKARYARVR